MPGWRSGVPVELGERPQARGPGGLQALGHGLDVAQLVRGNTLRVMRDVEAVAQGLQATRAPSLRTFADLDGNA